MRGERSNLLNSDNPDIARSVLKVRHNVKVDLTRAKHNQVTLGIIQLVYKDWLESLTWRKVVHFRSSQWVLQSNFWSGHDQRLSVRSQHLTTQDMEIVGWSCALSNLEINVLRVQVLVGVHV